MGRKHPLHIEYIHIGVCLGFIQDVVFEAILSHPRLKLEQKTTIIKALGKVLWIQNDLFAKWYVRDGEEFAADMEDPEIEQEGFLHGNRIIDPERLGGEEDATTGGCPFKGTVTKEATPGNAAPKPPKVTPHVTPHLASGIPRAAPAEKKPASPPAV